jgi:hypothetical protein
LTADDPYRIIQIVANKFQAGNITPTQYMDMINYAQLGFLDYLLGQFVSYQYGRPLSKVQFGMNEIVRQRITPLIDPVSTINIDATGFAAYPSDYQQADALNLTSLDRVRFVPQHKKYSYIKSRIDPVSTNPIFLIESQGFRFYPNTNFNGVSLGSIQLSYVKTPPDIVWGNSPDPQGRPQYNQGTSVNPIWYDTDMDELIVRALEMIGVNLQAPEISQYAQMIKNEGQ